MPGLINTVLLGAAIACKLLVFEPSGKDLFLIFFYR